MRFDSFENMIAYYADKTPDAPALSFAVGSARHTLSYKKLLEKILSRASALKAEGRTCLGIVCDGTADCIIEIFAAVKAGLQVVLLNENALPEQIAKTDVDVLWGDPDVTAELSAALTSGVEGGKGRILFFTSGTTAKTKSVVLTEKSLCASAYNGGYLLPLHNGDTLMCMLPLDHVFGFVCALLWGLSFGACIALGRGPRHYFDDCAFFRPTVLSAVPLLLGFLLQRKLLNPGLRLVLIGAGDCPKQIPSSLRQMGIRVSFGYGLTETSSGVALSLGADPYAMTVCPDDEILIAEDGEILIKNTTCMMQGYYKDSAATDAVLIDGVLHTGDLGYYDKNGLLHILGRKKEILVLSDGTKIYLPEYEQKLSPLFADTEFAVIEKDGAPALVLRGKRSEQASAEARLEPVMRALPIAHRIRKIYFVTDPLPRTATGKIKRWELQQKVGLL